MILLAAASDSASIAVMDSTTPSKRTYIHQLQDEVAGLRGDKIVADEAVADLVAYLTGPKFARDTTVQVADVLARLEPVRSALGYASPATTDVA